MSELTNTINLVMGDWSNDGHCKTDTITIVCNLDKKALALAYKAGAKKLRVDVSKKVAEEYQDATLSKADWQKFTAAGMTLKQLFAHPYFRKAAEGDLKDKDMPHIRYRRFRPSLAVHCKTRQPQARIRFYTR